MKDITIPKERLITKKKTETKWSLDLLRLEFRQHDAGGAHPQRAQQLINNAMHMVERQGVEDDIISGPSPL